MRTNHQTKLTRSGQVTETHAAEPRDDFHGPACICGLAAHVHPGGPLLD